MYIQKLLLFCAALIVLFPVAAGAQAPQAGESIPQDMLQFGSNVHIDVPVSRDVITFGGTVEINESVMGDVLAVGGTVVIRGTVAGDVRAAGGRVIILGEVGGNVAAAGNDIQFAEGSSILGSVALFGERVRIEGTVAGDVTVNAKTIEILGTVAGEVSAIERTPRAGGASSFAGLISLISLFGMLVVGLVVTSVAPKSLRAMVRETARSPWRDFAWGIGVLVVVPLAALFLGLTIIGIPLALIVLAAYVAALYVSQIVLGVVLGTYVVGAIRGRPKVESTSLIVTMVLGVLGFWLVTSIPVLGSFIMVLGVVWGLGLLVRTIAQVARRVRV